MQAGPDDAGGSAASGVRTLRIGALLPTSVRFPAVDHSFVAGLRGALTDAGVAFELLIEPTGNAAVKDLVTEKVQRMLLQHAPDVVTAVLGAGLSWHMHTMFRDAETPLVIADLGADPIMTGDQRNPFAFSLTLDLWRSSAALGYWAARSLGQKACIAAGFHEAGYGLVPAFWLGFQQAGGGTILSTEVTHRKSADDDPSEQLRRIAALNPDFVMSFYSGRDGISFANAWHDLGLSARLPLLASPLFTHDVWLTRMPQPPAGVRTAMSWDASAHADEQERFRRLAKVGEGKSPAVFALLGYETGRMLAAAAARNGSERSGGALCRALSGASFTSPRGRMLVDESTGEAVGTQDYLQELRRGPDGTWSHVTLEAILPPPSFRAAYDTVRQAEDRSGWLNPYLVA
jgi:branched-chain amino acid transport system substrate-binding protein